MSVAIKGNKLYQPLFVRILDMTIINAWSIHTHVQGSDKSNMSLLNFKRQVCLAYLKRSAHRVPPDRKKVQAPSNVPEDVRFDHKGHFLQKCDKQQRCQNKPCTAKPRTYCNKCTMTHV